MAFFYYNNFGGYVKIIVGKYSGFCNGVKYTVSQTLKELENNYSLFSLGDIVHNETVIDDLKKKGLIIENSINNIPNCAKVIIRAHGESVDTYNKAKEKKLDLIDLTCGKVKLIHTKILKNKDHSFILIIGKKNHPETIAHHSYSKNSFIIENISDIKEAYEIFLKSGFKEIYIVAQTTFNNDLFDNIVDEIRKVFKGINVSVDKTICNATNFRQQEVIHIARDANKMIIIGGKNSSNTKELEIISKNYCQEVYLIQTKDDLNNVIFNENDIVGITAGASTPSDVIDDVVDYLDNLYGKKK